MKYMKNNNRLVFDILLISAAAVIGFISIFLGMYSGEGTFWNINWFFVLGFIVIVVILYILIRRRVLMPTDLKMEK